MPRTSDFTTVGDIFSAGHQPRPQEGVRHPHPDARRSPTRTTATLERWAGMADAETAVVQDAHLGGIPVCLLGIESKSVPRRGFPPTDGPDAYTAGTLFPRSSKKAARAINAASGNRPLVVLANLSGLRRVTGLDAQPPARVRRRDRPGHRQLRRADRLRRRLALPRWRVRRVLQGAQPADDGARRRGLVRLGHRRRPGGGGRVRPRRRRAHRRRPAGRASSRRGWPRPPVPSAPGSPPSWPSCAPRCAPRSSARWRPSSTGCTASTGRSGRLGRRGIDAARAAAADHRRARGRACRPLMCRDPPAGLPARRWGRTADGQPKALVPTDPPAARSSSAGCGCCRRRLQPGVVVVGAALPRAAALASAAGADRRGRAHDWDEGQSASLRRRARAARRAPSGRRAGPARRPPRRRRRGAARVVARRGEAPAAPWRGRHTRACPGTRWSSGATTGRRHRRRQGDQGRARLPRRPRATARRVRRPRHRAATSTPPPTSERLIDQGLVERVAPSIERHRVSDAGAMEPRDAFASAAHDLTQGLGDTGYLADDALATSPGSRCAWSGRCCSRASRAPARPRSPRRSPRRSTCR